MASKSTKTQVVTIDDSAMEEFKVEVFDIRKYNAIFYTIRDLYGKESRRQLGDDFDWKAFKAQFEICFGTPEERRYSVEQLLTFAQMKFNMGKEDLLAYNRKSWEIRNKQEELRAKEQGIPVNGIPF
nr:hypothetical protein [Hassalia byssoidea]